MMIRKIAMAIHEGVQALDVAGPVDVFHEANNYLPEVEHYETILLAVEPGPLRASNRMQMLADYTFDNIDGRFDMFLVAGGPALPDAAPDPRLIERIRAASARADVYGSICTGAFLLGHAGLLDHHRVTTHWQHTEKLSALFPHARVEPDAIFVKDEPLVTSAGVTAGVDLALALVAQSHGRDLAVKVAKRLVVVAQRQGGQSQFSPYLTVPSDPESPVARIQNHVMAHIDQRHTLESLAAEVGMSPRNLARYFVQETGVTPHEFVQRARIDAARMMLEASNRPLKTIAFACGFGTVDRMRIVFGERLGVSPAQYRQHFRQDAADSHAP